MVNTEQVLQQDEQRWSAFMAAAQQGNETVYRELLIEISAAISRYLLKHLGRQHFIEDCVQDCLIAVHQARHSYDPKRLFRPWLFAIVRHKAIDTLRKQKTYHKALEQNILNQQCLEQTEHQQDEQLLVQGQLVAALTPDHREAITLTKMIGLTNAEAAKQLSISEGALKLRVHRAIGQLKQLLEKELP